jgi:hypothetical protein
LSSAAILLPGSSHAATTIITLCSMVKGNKTDLVASVF